MLNDDALLLSLRLPHDDSVDSLHIASCVALSALVTS